MILMTYNIVVLKKYITLFTRNENMYIDYNIIDCNIKY